MWSTGSDSRSSILVSDFCVACTAQKRILSAKRGCRGFKRFLASHSILPERNLNVIMGSMPGPNVDFDRLRSVAVDAIGAADTDLKELNKAIHGHPELAYKEYFAVETVTNLLEKLGFAVQRKTYGLDTSFTAEVGSGGELVVICAEYDALPNIGHACGHNLICTSSVAAFLGAAKALSECGFPGRVRLLGTPAEEGQGGKVKLIEAGAFKDKIAASIMAHPLAQHQFGQEYSGLAGPRFIASYKFKVEFHGKAAHASGEPWNGVNALDAAVATYNNISLLRQSMRSDERVHGVFEDGGTVPNVITAYSRMNWYVRSLSVKRAEVLLGKVRKCCEAAAMSTGCEVNYIECVSRMPC
jgi:amidohydrolase